MECKSVEFAHHFVRRFFFYERCKMFQDVSNFTIRLLTASRRLRPRQAHEKEKAWKPGDVNETTET